MVEGGEGGPPVQTDAANLCRLLGVTVGEPCDERPSVAAASILMTKGKTSEQRDGKKEMRDKVDTTWFFA